MDKLLAIAEKHLAKNYGWLPLVPVAANGCWLQDQSGKRYLDFVACYSALNFGNANPVLTAALKKQLSRGLAVTPGFLLTEDKVLLAKELSEFCGFGEEGKALFMVTGAEAVETAMKIARKWAYVKKGVPENKAEIIFCVNNFHGRTTGIISASTVEQYRKYFGPYLPGIKLIPFGSELALKKAITPNTAAFFVEPIQGEGGIVVPPPGYLDHIRETCDRRNTLLVFDEIQTGFYRTGKPFASDWEYISPDLMTIGKALGGGLLPLSAVVGKSKVLEVLQPGDHGSTFGGFPLACYVARAVLQLVGDPKFEARIKKISEVLWEEWQEIYLDYPFIKEVRGKGMMIGVELSPKGPSGHEVCEELLKEGVLMKETRDNVLRCSPPLVISVAEIRWAMGKVRRVFNRFNRAKGGRR